MVETPIFKSFTDYWYFTKSLSEHQRQIIFKSLPLDQRMRIEESYDKGGWDDVLMRNELNQFLDEIKRKDGYDLLAIRCKVLSGKSVYLPRRFWDKVFKKLDEYNGKHSEFIIGGLTAVICEANRLVVLIVPQHLADQTHEKIYTPKQKAKRGRNNRKS